MRRFISISLLLLFALPLVSPLFAASTAEANVPVCCRRNGKHHCTMAKATQPSSGETKAQSPTLRERCPYNPASSATINLPFVADNIQASIFAGVFSRPVCAVQPEKLLRILFDHSHQKRGPPSLIPSHS